MLDLTQFYIDAVGCLRVETKFEVYGFALRIDCTDGPDPSRSADRPGKGGQRKDHSYYDRAMARIRGSAVGAGDSSSRIFSG